MGISRRITDKSHIHEVVVGEKYMGYNSTHLKNEKLFVATPIHIIVAQMLENMVKDRKKYEYNLCALL